LPSLRRAHCQAAARTVAPLLAVARVITFPGRPPWAFLEVDPHALASSALGKSQKSVHQLFNVVIAEQAEMGPTIVLLDEVETLFTDRSQLSMEAKPDRRASSRRRRSRRP
jgi:ATP-dependent 26S proteasome regulatory subunit